jgi:hypothetical protein
MSKKSKNKDKAEEKPKEAGTAQDVEETSGSKAPEDENENRQWHSDNNEPNYRQKQKFLRSKSKHRTRSAFFSAIAFRGHDC